MDKIKCDECRDEFEPDKLDENGLCEDCQEIFYEIEDDAETDDDDGFEQ